MVTLVSEKWLVMVCTCGQAFFGNRIVLWLLVEGGYMLSGLSTGEVYFGKSLEEILGYDAG